MAESQLQGFKYFKKLLPRLDRLHVQATTHDRAGNLTEYPRYAGLERSGGDVAKYDAWNRLVESEKGSRKRGRTQSCSAR